MAQKSTEALRSQARRDATELFGWPDSRREVALDCALSRCRWPLTSLDGIRVARAMMCDEAHSACQLLNAKRSIPMLIEAADHHYDKSTSKSATPSWFGVASKLCISLVWRNLSDRNLPDFSVDALWRAIGACAAWHEMQKIELLFRLAGDEGCINFVAGSGFDFSSNLSELEESFLKINPKLRTPDYGAPKLAGQPMETLQAIRRLLDGVPAHEIDHLINTPLQFVKTEHAHPLLAHIWALTELLFAVVVAAEQGTRGVVLLSDVRLMSMPKRLVSMPRQLFRHKGMAERLLFWDSNWHATLKEEEHINAVLERPLIRIGKYNIATSLLFALDAYAYAIESAFFRYRHMEPLHLPEAAFKAAFSERLEGNVVKICRNAGYTAGMVTEAGAWRNQSVTQPLRHPSGLTCPGEMDCLALAADGRTGYLFECKLLSLPRSFSMVRNLSSRMGSNDKDSFQAKLGRKVEWIKAALDLHEVRSGIIVDRFVPSLKSGPHRQIDISELDAILRG